MIISYQLFTQTAVFSIATFIEGLWVTLGELLIPNIGMIAFIHAFAWIFVLSSVIPSAILGKERSILLQFCLCLTIAFVAVSVENILTLMLGAEPTVQIQALSLWFQNPLIAGLYLSAPYLFMLFMDIRLRKTSKETKENQNIEETETTCLMEPDQAQQYVITMTHNHNNVSYKESQRKSGRINFLHGTSAICFLLVFFILWFGDGVSSTLLPTAYRFTFAAMLIILGVVMLGLGFNLANIQKQSSTCEPEETKEQHKLIKQSQEKEAKIQAKQPSEVLVEESTAQDENLLEVQVYTCIQRYDVRRPKDIIDSQC